MDIQFTYKNHLGRAYLLDLVLFPSAKEPLVLTKVVYHVGRGFFDRRLDYFRFLFDFDALSKRCEDYLQKNSPPI